MTASNELSTVVEGLPFDAFVDTYRKRVEALIAADMEQLRRNAVSVRLADAMAYSVLNGGKRVRALLVYAAAMAVGQPNELTDRVAVALEYIHAYSLVHDDLPAMDNDELRRGKPTCHIAYDEATAILAGDALQTRAFEYLLAGMPGDTVLPVLGLIAKASGAQGMAAGQSIDLDSVDKSLNLQQLKQMHSLKTGALICASVEAGALSTGELSEQALRALRDYANAIGLAFQIQDDILDVTADTRTLGKAQGADEALNKPTFVSLMGLNKAEKAAEELHLVAAQAVDFLGEASSNLSDIAVYIIRRSF